KRRFENTDQSLLSKQQSYWISGSVMVLLLGFTMQHHSWGTYQENLTDNFYLLLMFQLCLFLGLIAALTPQRETLQAWSRYRHQMPHRRRLWADLVWGEKSPATVAIALNLIPTSAILLVALMMLPFGESRLALILGLLLQNGIILVYASLTQWLLLQKTRRRVVFAAGAIISHLVIPPTLFALFEMSLPQNSAFFLWSGFPFASTEYVVTAAYWTIVGQSLVTALINVQFTRQLRTLGESESKPLLSDSGLAVNR
ncbi:MAG: ABC transporter permease, partial [Kamptonema sp. SIO4C4]|nr:ABC transporter permease [Kamptonema sp. SIO4C4]